MTPKAGSGSTIFQGIFLLLSLALLARSETENIPAGVNQDGNNDVFSKNLSNQGKDINAQYFASTTELINKFVELNSAHDSANLNDDDEKEPTTPKSTKDVGTKSLKDDTNVNYNGNSQTASPEEIVTIGQNNSKLIETPNLIPEDSVDKLKNFKYTAEQVLDQPNGVVEEVENKAMKIETITTTTIEPALSIGNTTGSLLPRSLHLPSSELNTFNTGEKVTTKESSTSAPTKEILPDLYYKSSPTASNHSTTNQPKDTDNIINRYDQNATDSSNHQIPAEGFKSLSIKRSENKVTNGVISSSLAPIPTKVVEINQTDGDSKGLQEVLLMETSTESGNGTFPEEPELKILKEATVLPSTVNITTTTEPIRIAEILTTNSPKILETTSSIILSTDESTNLDTSETTTAEIKTTSEMETTMRFTDLPTTEILSTTTIESITSPVTQDTTTENNPETTITTTEIPSTENISTIDDVIPETTLQTTPLPEEPTTTITEFTSQENLDILNTTGAEGGRGIYSTQEMNFTNTTPTTLIIPDVENKTSDLNTASVGKISSTTIPSISSETSPETNTSDSTNTTTSPRTEITTTTIQNNVYPRSGQNVDVVVKIIVEANWTEVCRNLPELQKSLADLLSTSLNKSVGANQIIFQTDGCKDNIPDPVVTLYFYVINKNGQFDPKMTEILPALYSSSSIKTNLTISSVELIQNTDSGNAIAVVVVCCVAFICLVLLAGLLFIMRKRQTRFNYGERCRPVSLDAYSLDSVSAYNSVRRKGAIRSSKRSYGNPTFEDSTVIPSHPLNFSVLSKFCNEENKIYEEYSNIPQVTAKIDELPPGAEIKNRYANVIPLPETRVPLAKINNDSLTEYINASYVRGPKNATKYYIACQAPIESTVADFWRMIWEQQTKVIIMLTELVENDVEKCAEYIPPSEVTDCRRLYGDFQVTLKKRETKEKYAISTLYLKNLEDKTYREISHIWYLWPTSGIQTDGVGMIAVLLEARALQRGGPGPIVVHCSPGTGRTGTLIALDLGIRQYEITRTVDVPRVVYTIRRDRAGAVQTKEQYAFIYKALNLYATKLAGGGLEST